MYESVIFVREYRFAWESESAVVCESLLKKEVRWVEQEI